MAFQAARSVFILHETEDEVRDAVPSSNGRTVGIAAVFFFFLTKATAAKEWCHYKVRKMKQARPFHTPYSKLSRLYYCLQTFPPTVGPGL